MKTIKSAKTSDFLDALNNRIAELEDGVKSSETIGSEVKHSNSKRQFRKHSESHVKGCNSVKGGAAATVAKMVAPVVIDKIADKVFDGTDSCNKVESSQHSEPEMGKYCDSEQLHSDNVSSAQTVLEGSEKDRYFSDLEDYIRYNADQFNETSTDEVIGDLIFEYDDENFYVTVTLSEKVIEVTVPFSDLSFSFDSVDTDSDYVFEAIEDEVM